MAGLIDVGGATGLVGGIFSGIGDLYSAVSAPDAEEMQKKAIQAEKDIEAMKLDAASKSKLQDLVGQAYLQAQQLLGVKTAAQTQAASDAQQVQAEDKNKKLILYVLAGLAAVFVFTKYFK